MGIAAYLRHGITVIFCPRCQVVRELSRAPVAVDDVPCPLCAHRLETVTPTNGSAPAVAK